ncbi:MAG: FtsW/RodA/SpoVE family cell cycle protein [bacterium]
MGYLLKQLSAKPGLYFNIAVLALGLIGTPFVVSAEWYHTSSGAFTQFLFLLGGIVLFYVFSRVHYEKWVRMDVFLYFFSLGLLALPIFWGHKRWIYLGPLSFQPYEFAKIGIVIFLASILTKARKEKTFWKTTLLPFLFLVPPVLILIRQPHFGACVVLLLTAGSMFWLSGIRLTHLLGAFFLSLLILALLLPLEEYRLRRLTSAYENDPLAGGYQKRQALIAIGSGGPFGKGFGNSVMKLGFLPEAHSDFLFAVVAEELGFALTLILFFLPFLLLLLSGFSICLSAPSPRASLIAGGLTCLLFIQSMINLSMVCLKFIPVTGIPLPFFTHGGSSLLSSFLTAGIISNIARTKGAQ